MAALANGLLMVAGLTCATSALGGSSSPAVIAIDASTWRPGIRHALKGPFAVYVWCEDALGSHIGVIYTGHLGAPLDGAWRLSDRFWQHETWASDATAVAWSPDGRELFVSTSPVYGSGSVFRLRLPTREAEEIYSRSDDTCMTKLTGLDPRRRKVKILVTRCKTLAESEEEVEYSR